MLEKIAFTLALLSAATVAALPRYHEWQRMDYEDMTARVTANIQMISGGPCAQVKEEENGITYVVRICEAEDEGEFMHRLYNPQIYINLWFMHARMLALILKLLV